MAIEKMERFHGERKVYGADQIRILEENVKKAILALEEVYKSFWYMKIVVQCVTVMKSRYLLTKIIRLQLLTTDEESRLELIIKRENRRSKLYLPCCMPVVNWRWRIQVSGGLHGVGASVVNALSDWLEVEIYQDGKKYIQRYEKGKTMYPLKEIGTTDQRGTKVTFLPDETPLRKQQNMF